MAFKVLSLPTREAPEGESLAATGLRNLVATDVTIAENLLGAPGNVEQGLLGLGNAGINLLTGKKPLPHSITGLPSTEQLRKHYTQPLAKELLPRGYLEPQSGKEAGLQEFAGDLTAALHPLFGVGSLPKALSTLGLGNFAKWGAKNLGFQEEGQHTAKAGTMLLTGLLGTPSLKNYASSLYQKAPTLVPETATVPGKTIIPLIDKMAKRINKGDVKVPSKVFIKDRLEAIENSLKKEGGHLNIHEALELKQDFNELFQDAPERAQKDLGKLVNSLNNVLRKESAAQGYTDFAKTITEADDIWKGIHEAPSLYKRLSKYVNFDRFLAPATAVVLGMHPKGSLLTAGTLLGSNQIIRLLEGFSKNSSIRNYYLRTLGAAAKNQGGLAARYADKLDKSIFNELREEQPVGKFKILKV